MDNVFIALVITLGFFVVIGLGAAFRKTESVFGFGDSLLEKYPWLLGLAAASQFIDISGTYTLIMTVAWLGPTGLTWHAASLLGLPVVGWLCIAHMYARRVVDGTRKLGAAPDVFIAVRLHPGLRPVAGLLNFIAQPLVIAFFFGGLLSFFGTLGFEPRWGLTGQEVGWRIGIGVVMAVAVCTTVSGKAGTVLLDFPQFIVMSVAATAIAFLAWDTPLLPLNQIAVAMPGKGYLHPDAELWRSFFGWAPALAGAIPNDGIPFRIILLVAVFFGVREAIMGGGGSFTWHTAVLPGSERKSLLMQVMFFSLLVFKFMFVLCCVRIVLGTGFDPDRILAGANELEFPGRFWPALWAGQPEWFKVLVVLALTCAWYSTVDGMINANSLCATNDIVRPLWRGLTGRDLNSRAVNWLGRIATISLAMGGLAIARWGGMGLPAIWNIVVWVIGSALGGGLLMCVWERYTVRGYLIGMFTGGAAALARYLGLISLGGDIQQGLILWGLSITGGIVGSLAFKWTADEQRGARDAFMLSYPWGLWHRTARSNLSPRNYQAWRVEGRRVLTSFFLMTIAFMALVEGLLFPIVLSEWFPAHNAVVAVMIAVVCSVLSYWILFRHQMKCTAYAMPIIGGEPVPPSTVEEPVRQDADRPAA